MITKEDDSVAKEEIKKQIIADIENGEPFLFFCLRKDKSSYLNNSLPGLEETCFASKLIETHLTLWMSRIGKPQNHVEPTQNPSS